MIHFKFLWILLVVVVIAFCVMVLPKLFMKETAKERANTQCVTEERVFDFANKLTDQEENELRTLISKRENQIKSDIVLLIIDEDLSPEGYYSEAEYYSMIEEYANEFYNTNKFGYNKAIGDGALFIDNWHREEDGSIYSGLLTKDRVHDTYSQSMREELIADVTSKADASPFEAYKTYVNKVYADMSGINLSLLPFIIIIVIVTCIYLFYGVSKGKGKRTTVSSTYISEGKPTLRDSKDRFIRKTVTTRIIPKNNGNGGGSGGSRSGFSGGRR